MIKVKLLKDLDVCSELKIYNEEYFPLAFSYVKAWMSINKRTNSYKIEGKDKQIKSLKQYLLKQSI
jgi:hypothetical protein